MRFSSAASRWEGEGEGDIVAVYEPSDPAHRRAAERVVKTADQLEVLDRSCLPIGCIPNLPPIAIFEDVASAEEFRAANATAVADQPRRMLKARGTLEILPRGEFVWLFRVLLANCTFLPM